MHRSLRPFLNVCFVVSTLATLSANASSPAGFDDYYDVKTADIDGDGLTDLYVYSTPKIVVLAGDVATAIVTNAPAAVADFALLQQANGSFAIDGTLTQTQRDLAKNAPRLSVDLKVADYNADGRTDLFTGKLSQFSGFSNARSAFVFAPANTGQPPTQIRAVDDALVDFFVQASGMIAGTDYIRQTQIRNGWYSYQGNFATGWFVIGYISSYYQFRDPADDIWLSFLDEEDDPEDSNNPPQYCSYYPADCRFVSDINDAFYGWNVYGTYQENIQVIYNNPSTNFNNDALTFNTSLPQLQAGADTVSKSVLESVLGVPVGGAFQAAAQQSPVQSQLPQSDHPFVDTMISFGNMAAAIFNDIDLEDVKAVAEVGAEIFVPGYDLYVCATHGGCSTFDIAMGVIGVIPGGKTVSGAIKIGRIGGKLAHEIGKAGETLVRAAHDIGPINKTPRLINGRWRIPDGETLEVVSEIKNRASQSLTRQLKDLLDYASDEGKEFHLYVRGTDGYGGSGAATKLSGPLKDAICAEQVFLKAIPGTGSVQLPTCP